jgi:hypothetical protein
MQPNVVTGNIGLHPTLQTQHWVNCHQRWVFSFAVQVNMAWEYFQWMCGVALSSLWKCLNNGSGNKEELSQVLLSSLSLVLDGHLILHSR